MIFLWPSGDHVIINWKGRPVVVVLRASWVTFKLELEKKKKKKMHPKKIPYNFRNNFLALLLRKIYIFSNETLHFSPEVWKIKQVHLKKICYTWGNGNPKIFFYIFSKESFSYISENGHHKKFFIFQETELSYILGNPQKLSELETF